MTTGDAGGTIGGDTVKTTFNRIALEAYHAENVYRAVADVKWDENSDPMPGNPVTFTIISALAVATTPISETVEPTPVNVSDTQKSITLAEYGNAVKPSKKLKLTSFLNMDLAVPQEVSKNMEESVDIVARDILVAGTNVFYSGSASSRATVTAASNFSAANARRCRQFLVGKNTPPPPGSNLYVGYIHPDVSYDLMGETGQAAWTAPHAYVDTMNFYAGEIGSFNGVRWVENANARFFADAGSPGTVDVYATIVCGRQALGEAVGEAQHMVISGPFDDLQRFISIGWYGMLGFGRIRENSLVRFESASSIGAN